MISISAPPAMHQYSSPISCFIQRLVRLCVPHKIGCLLVCINMVSGCAALDSPTELAAVPEIRPGILQGYLPVSAQPTSKTLIPPPPAQGSAEMAVDQAVNRDALSRRQSARWRLAAEDANLMFPRAAGTFSCALNAPVTQQETPHLYRLLRRTLADAGLSTYSAKQLYQRRRPFLVNGEPTCKPEDEAHLATDGSYPSGHPAIGWAWGLILAEIAPSHSDALVARGRAFGQSRVVCNVHWQSDVNEGRIVGAAAVARLHADTEFNKDLVAAKTELAAVYRRGLKPTRDCAVEATALAH